jgi:nitrite reductase (cytochrome c-552)
MSEPTSPANSDKKRRFSIVGLVLAMVITAVLTFAITGLLVSIFNRKQEAKNPYLKLVEVYEDTTDPEVWRLNWPRQYDGYSRTVDHTQTQYGGSEAFPKQKAERDPWLTRMFAGYAFALDYRERRGHAYMLHDQEQTRRVHERPQPGACLHCHSSVIPTYRRLGEGDVFKGFEMMSTIPYWDAHAEVVKTGSRNPSYEGTSQQAVHVEGAHPVSCVDCHDPRNMELRVTRPAFIIGIQKLAESDSPVPHVPSIERWRKGDRKKPYDPNTDATRQEMRSFACAQCHVEYYCGPKTTMFYPWGKGLKVEEIEAYYEEFQLDGTRFYDWKHAETGAEVLKAQHPEFELWSQGVHARAGVACADCHMPYERVGAVKVSDHWVRSPLVNIARACQTCHNVPEAELHARATAIQDRTRALMDRGGAALVDLLDAIKAAKDAGASEQQLHDVLELQRKAQWRLDFIAAENSMGFHASQESARILGEAIDYARQGQVAALKLAGPATRPGETAER